MTRLEPRRGSLTDLGGGMSFVRSYYDVNILVVILLLAFGAIFLFGVPKLFRK